MDKLIDLTGQRFGHWIVIDRYINYNEPASLKNGMWNCKCDCGKFKVVLGKHLRAGESTQCNKCNVQQRHIERKLNIKPGDKFFDWTVLSLATIVNRRSNDKNIYWLCECKCKRQLIIAGTALKSGTRQGCKICRNAKKPKHILSKIYRNICQGARARKLSVTISIDELWQLYLSQGMKCAISGVDIIITANVRNTQLTTASVDRIDSSKGYIQGNVQWVHRDINRMKWDLSQKKFIELCAQVVFYQQNKSII